MTCVLITRPQAASEALASMLQSRGYETVIEPLLSIIPTHTPLPRSGAIEAVMITSGNALFALKDRQSEFDMLFDLPCLCVGPRTAEKAGAFGFRRVQSAAGDGLALARLISTALPGKKASLLHVAGREADSKARQDLEGFGHHIIDWPVYEALAATDFTPLTQDLLKKRRLDAIVVFSPRTASVLRDLLAKAVLETCCAELAAICLSEAVAEMLRPLGWRCLRAAPQPTEDAVTACLQEVCPVTP